MILSGVSRSTVQSTAELLRVLALPRRTWTAQEVDHMRVTLEGFLRRPGSTASLLPKQAQALFELWYLPGLFCPMRVGSGKTLVTLLAPVVTNASRPMLFVPAALVSKTKREAATYAQDWRVPNHLRIESYELLGRAQSVDMLDRYQPDLLILDEGHWLKNTKASRTKKVVRYLRSNLEARLVVLSGTITKRSILDFAHLLALALRARGCPMPTHYGELENWSLALDEKGPDVGPTLPGQLVHLCNKEELKEGHPSGTRKAFRRRLVETHGVVASDETPIDASLHFQIVKPPVPHEIKEALSELRRTWTTPNGEAFADGPTMWRHAREMALGFWYRWDPPAPEAWLEKRKAWASLCRGILAGNQRRLDSEAAAAQAVDQGHYPHALKALEEWRAIRRSFVPNTVAEWISPYLVDWIHEQTRNAPPTIIWVDVVAFARALAKKTGLVYYGQGGLSEDGRSIEQAPADQSLIAGIESNKEGRNLQRFNRNLIVTVPPNGVRNEQVIGRTHRPFQKADEVLVQFVIACVEHEAALEQSWLDARYTQDATGVPQKLLVGDWI